MPSQRSLVRNQTRISLRFIMNSKKFRVCYTPSGAHKSAALQLNYHITEVEPFVRRVAALGKYLTIRVYLSREYEPVSRPFVRGFIDALDVPGYDCREAKADDKISTSQELSEYVHICTFVKRAST
ncbi:hypothetical protein PAPHI01_1468 [Pancytospora philotis]|nr:hypothetical protein PAPHI01_1468 [Pancytospora philotis]